MAEAFVYSILAVFVAAIVSTTGFPSRVYEEMTRAERLAIFGSEDSVPEYKVFTMTKSGNKITLQLEINGTETVLNLNKTAGYLVTKDTPVWLAVTDPSATNHVRYEPLPTAMWDIGKFKMYHDVKNDAAITVFTDPVEGTIIEGIVTSHFAIRSLPKRLMGTPLKLGDHVLETFPLRKRSIVSDTEEDMGYFVLFKVPDAPEADKSILTHRDYLHRERRSRYRNGKRKIPKAVYPELLLVLDHNAIRHHTITEALRFMLAFWNGVDLVYSALDEPKVHLNIAGIIIAADDWATPYIAANATASKIGDIARQAEQMEIHFSKVKRRLPMMRYDVIIAMTTARLCNEMLDPCQYILGNAGSGSACSSSDNDAFIHYNWAFGGVDTTIHEIAHLFGVSHDEGYGPTAACDAEAGYVMTPSAQHDQQIFKWSNCSLDSFKTFFSSDESKCLDNEPQWAIPADEALTERQLPMEGQCQHYGYKKSCALNKTSICMSLGCENSRSKCIRTRHVPLPGTECGRRMYCNSDQKCVHRR